MLRFFFCHFCSTHFCSISFCSCQFFFCISAELRPSLLLLQWERQTITSCISQWRLCRAGSVGSFPRQPHPARQREDVGKMLSFDQMIADRRAWLVAKTAKQHRQWKILDGSFPSCFGLPFSPLGSGPGLFLSRCGHCTLQIWPKCNYRLDLEILLFVYTYTLYVCIYSILIPVGW